MKRSVLTAITKKVGDFVASKTKDSDNELFAEVTEKVIDEFIKEIKKDNPVLASWVEDWGKKTAQPPVVVYERHSSGSCADDMIIVDGGCGVPYRHRKSYGGCGCSGGCGSTRGGC